MALGTTTLGPVASADGGPGFVPLATYAQPDNVPGPLACSGSFCLLIAYTGAETDVNTPAELAGVLVSTDGGATWQDRGVPTLLADMLQFPPADLSSGAIHLQCTSATTCLVAQYGRVARTTDGGSTWAAVPGALSDNANAELACAVSGGCLEVAAGATAWLAPGAPRFQRVAKVVPVGSVPTSLSCPTASRCVLAVASAVGRSGGVFVSDDAGIGMHWVQAPRSPGRFIEDLACATAARCVGTELLGASVAGSAPRLELVRSLDGGVEWSDPHAIAPSGDRGTSMFADFAIACASALDCTVVASPYGNVDGDSLAAAWRTTDGGATWPLQTPLADFGPASSATPEAFAACTTSLTFERSCLVDAGNVEPPDYSGVLASTAFRSTVFTYLSPSSATTSASSLDCTTDSTCWRVGQYLFGPAPGTRLEVSHDDGTSWSRVAVPTGDVPVLVGGCQSATACEVIVVRYASLLGHQLGVVEFEGDNVVMLSTTNGGATWTSTPMPGTGLMPLTASCTSSTACVVLQQVAQDEPYPEQATDEFESTTDGVTWSMYTLPDELTPLAGAALGWGWAGTLSCSTGGVCLAGGPFGLRSTNGGLSWADSPPTSRSPATDVVCFTGQTCDALSQESPGGLAQTTDGGLTWTSEPLPSGANGATPMLLACSSPSTCTVAQAGYNGAPAIGFAATTTDAGATWTPLSWGATFTAGTDDPGNLTCSATACLVEDLYNQLPEYQLLRYAP